MDTKKGLMIMVVGGVILGLFVVAVMEVKSERKRSEDDDEAGNPKIIVTYTDMNGNMQVRK